MNTDEKYMQRCIQIAENGKGFVAPNPMVGAVVVYNDTIIGEGYHREYGKSHAEVNAINSVKDKTLLPDSTIYVSLEPCSHYGKTPPCAQLIIDSNIKRVVIASLDTYFKVSGKGVKMLQDAGIEVKIGVLEEEAKKLNKHFFTLQTLMRPYVYLKWAQTKDGFIDKLRKADEKPQPTPISNDYTKVLVHKHRAEVASIMVGTNTAINDNPSLTTRFWYGKNPIRIIIDRQGRIPGYYTIFKNDAETIIFTESVDQDKEVENVKYIYIRFDENLITNILHRLGELKIDSILVEGGRQLLQSFIDQKLWDEAYIEIGEKEFGEGVKAPKIEGKIITKDNYHNSTLVDLIK